jgi:hypothetical protein
MRFSLFAHWRDNSPQARDAENLAEFCEKHIPAKLTSSCAEDIASKNNELKRRQINEELKKRTPAFSPSEFLPGKTRAKENVVAIHALVYDLDGVDPELLDQRLDEIKGAGAEHALYTSFGHGDRMARDGKIKCRLIFALDRPLKSNEFDHAWWVTQDLVLKIPVAKPGEDGVDGQCRDIARIYGLPATPDPSTYFSFFEPGDPLCVDILLAQPLPAGAKAIATTSAPKVETDQIQTKELKALSAKLCRSAAPEQRQLGAWLEDVYHARPWAKTETQRHATMLRITAALDRHYPHVSIDALTALMAPSIKVMSLEQDGFDYDARVTDARRAIEGARNKRVAAVEQAKQDAEAERQARMSAIRPDKEAREYDEVDLAELCKLAGCTRDALDRHWLIGCGQSVYFLTLDGYKGPYSPADAPTAARDLLAPAPVQLHRMTEKGPKAKTYADLSVEYGTIASNVAADLSAQRSTFADGVLTEAVCPLRKLEPEYNETVEEYLAILGGKHAEKLKDWCATVTHLDQMTCALYFAGEKDSGKTLFGKLVSRLWSTTGVTELGRILDNFNSDLTRCPIVVADEEISHRSRKLTSAELRTFLGNNTRTLSRKYHANASLRGAPRLILAANNNGLLSFKEDQTQQDLEATAERFLHIEIGPEVGQWLASRGMDSEWIEQRWFRDERFAKHLLWMRDNRKVTPSTRRFLVTGEMGELIQRLATSTDLNDRLCEFLATYLTDPVTFDAQHKGKILRENGELYVSAAAISDGWESCTRQVGRDDRPSISRAARALKSLAADSVQKRVTSGQSQVRLRFAKIRLDYLWAWAERNGVGDVEQMRQQLC